MGYVLSNHCYIIFSETFQVQQVEIVVNVNPLISLPINGAVILQASIPMILCSNCTNCNA